MEHPIGNLMDTTMNKIKEMVDVNTIVGEPITAPRRYTHYSCFKGNLRFCGRRLGSSYQKKKIKIALAAAAAQALQFSLLHF